MKYLTYAFVLFFFGCGKDDETLPVIDNKLYGKWQLEATKISPGGIVEDWTMVSNGTIIEFRSNGSYSDTSKVCGGIVNGIYSVKEGILSLRYVCNGNSMEANFRMNFSDDRLILANVGCIEECSYRYRKLE